MTIAQVHPILKERVPGYYTDEPAVIELAKRMWALRYPQWRWDDRRLAWWRKSEMLHAAHRAIIDLHGHGLTAAYRHYYALPHLHQGVPSDLKGNLPPDA